jgi:hypothetical protein
MVKRTILVSGLVAMAAASLAQGLSGADLVPVVFNIAVSLVAAIVVLWTRRPTVGLIAAIWLSLGWALMPEYTLTICATRATRASSPEAWLNSWRTQSRSSVAPRHSSSTAERHEPSREAHTRTSSRSNAMDARRIA